MKNADFMRAIELILLAKQTNPNLKNYKNCTTNETQIKRYKWMKEVAPTDWTSMHTLYAQSYSSEPPTDSDIWLFGVDDLSLEEMEEKGLL